MILQFLPLIILLEILLSCLVAWGILNEEKLVNFENQIIKKILRK